MSSKCGNYTMNIMVNCNYLELKELQENGISFTSSDTDLF